VIVLGLLTVAVGSFALTRGGEDRAPVTPSPRPSPSLGITQAQLDKLGDSIEARYRSGDTEVAQALLDNFMDAHPECVSAVMGAGEGPLRTVLAQAESVSEQLEQTAPYPNAYTTTIIVPVSEEGSPVVRGAVLGVSCREGT
jgi:hypothetical protein